MARPEKPIDWERFDKLLRAQCSPEEIAGKFHMCVRKLYEKVSKEKGMSYGNYANTIYSEGKSILREVQYDKAIEGNITLLMKLGEIYLNQSEKIVVKEVDKTDLENENMELKARLAKYESIDNKSETKSEFFGGDTPL